MRKVRVGIVGTGIAFEPLHPELLTFCSALTGTELVSVTPEMEYGDMKTVLLILKSIPGASVNRPGDRHKIATLKEEGKGAHWFGK